MNAKKSKTKIFYWDPSGEEIYKSKLNSANRKVKKDIREYQFSPIEFKKDLLKIILKFIILFLFMSFLAIYPIFIYISSTALFFEDQAKFNDWLFEIIYMAFFFSLIVLIFSVPFLHLVKEFKYKKLLQKALIIDSLSEKNNWVYRILKREKPFKNISEKFYTFFGIKYVLGFIGNQLWGKYKSYNFILGDIDYRVTLITPFKVVKDIKNILFGKFIKYFTWFKNRYFTIYFFIFILFLGMFLIPEITIKIFLFFGMINLFFWMSLIVFMVIRNFSKKYSFLSIHLPKKNYQNLVLKPQKVFEKDLIGVESVKLSELFKIEGGEKIKDIKILSPKIQVGIEEMLNIQKIHSILFQGDTVIFLFHQPFFKKLYTDFSDGMKISQEGEIKFFQKIETMMKIVKKF